MAMSLVADHFGEIVTPPFEFDLIESGVVKLIEAVELAERSRSAVVVRVGRRGGWSWPGRTIREHEAGSVARRTAPGAVRPGQRIGWKARVEAIRTSTCGARVSASPWPRAMPS
jgi:hypothetical protein